MIQNFFRLNKQNRPKIKNNCKQSCLDKNETKL